MRRYVVLLATLIIGVFLAGGVTSSAIAAQASTSAKSKKKAAKPTVKVVSLQATQLAKGKVRVQVKANKGAKVRISATTSSFDTAAQPLFKARQVKLGNKRSKVFTLPVPAATKKNLSGCLARTLVIKGQNGKRKSSLKQNVVRNQADCAVQQINLKQANDCEFIAQPKEGLCMLPFPSDFYTVKDSKSPTGKRVNFTAPGMPHNAENTPIDPSKFSHSDGFSHSQGIVVRIPGVDSLEAVAANDLVPLNHLGDYSKPDQKVVIINAKTGERHPIWAEADSNASQDEDRTLEIKPAQSFDAKGRYIVAFRNLTNVNGTPLKAPDAFRYYRDQMKSNQAPINKRRAHFESIFKTLKKAGIKRGDLYLAWDFTVASNENNYGRVLSMRDRAFEELGDTNLKDRVVDGAAPDFQIDSIVNNPKPTVARKIKGSFTVPCFLEPNCGPGGTMNINDDGVPTRNGYYEANMECIVPDVALASGAPKMRPMVFGHGLFGDASGVDGGPNPPLAQTGMILCATDEIGMSNSDVVKVMTSALPDLSNFDVLTDRLAQALVNELFLARLMYHPQGLGTHPAFQDGNGITAGETMIRTDEVFYQGASQGGILGGPLTAISPDFVQSALLVGAMTYSILLPRSTNYDLYKSLLYEMYKNQMSHPLLLQLMQMLWDRSEPNGFTHVMTDNPPPNTPEHKVLLAVALGDHQVSNFTSDTMARSLGMKTNPVPLDEGRWPNYDALWNIPRLKASDFPYRGNSIVYFDGGPARPDPSNPSKTIGTDVPPLVNQPNRVAQDPHGAPGGAGVAVEMTSTFLQPNGYINDICSPKACYGDSWAGMP